MDNFIGIICCMGVMFCSTCLSTNVTVLKVVSGGIFGIYDFYMNKSMSGMLGSHFKSNIINDWNSIKVREVCIKLFKNGNSSAYFVFDGDDSNSVDWMTKDRLIRTSYGDITNDNLKYTQLSFQDARAIRRFYISAPHDGCHGDTGWLVVKDSTLITPCNIDKVNLTTIWYSALQTKTKFNDFQKADVMTVEIDIDVRCEDSNLTIVNMTYSMTGNQFNDTLTYSCLEGFTHTSGDLQSQCDHLGVWTGTRPICEKLCSCQQSNYIQLNETELRTRLWEIKSNLSVRANETSRARRLKKCARDDRPSTKAIGVLGGVLIGIFVILIVACDISSLLA